MESCNFNPCVECAGELKRSPAFSMACSRCGFNPKETSRRKSAIEHLAAKTPYRPQIITQFHIKHHAEKPTYSLKRHKKSKNRQRVQKPTEC